MLEHAKDHVLEIVEGGVTGIGQSHSHSSAYEQPQSVSQQVFGLLYSRNLWFEEVVLYTTQ